MKILCLVLLASFISLAHANHGNPTHEEILFYRDLSMKVRTEATFKIPSLDGKDTQYSYELNFADAIYPEPMVDDFHWDGDTDPRFYRIFFDRIFLGENSFMTVGDQKIPLTCIFIDGQDNRHAGLTSPLIPQFIMRIYLVANDFTCVGPINPGWPMNGGKKETWDTYVYYEIKDPTIMLPVEAHIRYRWNEWKSVLVK